MKKLFILLMILATTITFAEAPQVTGKAYNDLKEGTKTVYGDIKAVAPEVKTVLAEIAKVLKTTTEKVWDILVLQQQVWSWCFLFVTLSAMYLWWRFFRQYKIMTTDLDETGDIKTAQGFLTVILFALVMLDSTISAIHFGDMMTGFMNPEFGALKTVIEFAKTLK